MNTLVKCFFRALTYRPGWFSERNDGTGCFAVRNMKQLADSISMTIEFHHAIHPDSSIAGSGDRQHDIFCGGGVIFRFKLEVMISAVYTLGSDDENDGGSLHGFGGKNFSEAAAQ